MSKPMNDAAKNKLHDTVILVQTPRGLSGGIKFRSESDYNDAIKALEKAGARFVPMKAEVFKIGALNKMPRWISGAVPGWVHNLENGYTDYRNFVRDMSIEGAMFSLV